MIRSQPIRRASKAIARKTQPRRQRKGTRAGLLRKLNDLVSAYVKERDGPTCITCGAHVQGGNWHAGHFISRTRASTLFDPKNVHSQCGIPCNKFKRGALAEYAIYIIDRYGEPELRRIMARSKQQKKWTRPELERLIEAAKKGGAEYETAYYETEL